jgi:hypothetical protein
MNSESIGKTLPMVDAEVQSWPTAMEFELAYQARVAMDRIRFAIKHPDQFAQRTEQMQEVGLQLLDALQRLENAERRFQERSRIGSKLRSAPAERSFSSVAVSPTNSSAGTAAYGSNPAVPTQRARKRELKRSYHAA